MEQILDKAQVILRSKYNRHFILMQNDTHSNLMRRRTKNLNHCFISSLFYFNGKNKQYSETDSPICHNRCWTIWTNVNCNVECHSFSVCWFGMAYPHGVTMWRIKHLFGLALPHIENMKWIIWFQRRHIWRPKMTQLNTSTII